ncbi:uncharacterized protein LOC126743683 [Anthonomus grandis grandis]|uniref:uncharacterized protein LOC126743683 n=1 Tax=Anthonomus grandis grandis TaxID=2921223 RepID=UPI002165FF16|nr:uncharacterized protein LOC126743683 [Anthonomus grandis grandis]
MNTQQLKKLAEIINSLGAKVKCPICLDYINKWTELECRHKFCNTCISEIKSNKAYTCPLCKRKFNKRSPIFKDEFGEQLSKFVNKAAQLIKEKYAIEVEELVLNKTNIQKVIDTAPQDVPKQVPVELAKNAPQPSCSKVKNIIKFENNENRNKIIDWLNQNEDKFKEVLTQSFLPDDSSDEDFQMSSISQAERKRKKSRQRSQSWTDVENLPDPLVKRYQSLTEGLNKPENYNIEEDSSEKVVKQVEIKVLQNMLEEECLANLEQAAQLIKPKVKPVKKSKLKSTTAENKILNSSSTSFGWKRAADIKTDANKAPKSLNIFCQKTKEKTSPKRTSPREKVRKAWPSLRKTRSAEKALKEPIGKIVDLTTEEETVIPSKKTNREKEDIFSVPTQVTSHSIPHHIELYHISSVPPELTTIDAIANQLNKNIKSCISTVNDTELADCFSNLLTYVDKILEVSNKKVLSVSTQTVGCNKNSVEVQTVRNVSEKVVQTTQMICSSYAQTDKVCFIDQHVQVDQDSVKSPAVSVQGRKFQKLKPNKVLTSSSCRSKNIPEVGTKISRSRGTSNVISPNSVLVFSLESTAKTQKSVSRKLSYQESENSSKKFKRIRKPASDSDSDEDGNPSKKKFIKDDLTVDFIDSEKPNTGNSLQESEDMDYDKYLLEAMDRYDPSPPKKLFETPPVNRKKSQKKPSAQTDLDDHVFTSSTAFHANFDKFDAEIMAFEKNSKNFSTQLDVVEDTPVEERPIRKPKVHLEPLRILSRGSVDSTNNPSSQDFLHSFPQDNVGDPINNEMAELLEDLKNDVDFFKTPIETQNLSHRSDDVTRIDLKEKQSEAIKKDQPKINILQNIRLNDEQDLMDSSGDEGIVEGTPQKDKQKSNESFRSLTEILNHLNDQFGSSEENFDLCLPPPPGFTDDDSANIENQPVNKGHIDSQHHGLTKLNVTPKQILQKSEEPTAILTKSFEQKEETSQHNFSPIKCSAKLTPNRYTPLVTTQRSSLRNKSGTLMTSTPKQKSILNFVVSSQGTSNKPCITWSRIINKDLSVFTKLECKKLVSTSRVFTKEVTHLVVLVNDKGQVVSHTAKILQAIAAGIWIVRYEWAVDSLQMNKIVPEEPYEVLMQTGIPGPKLARLNRTKNPLFKNFKFYCSQFLKSLPIADLESILCLSGAEIAKDLGEMMENDGKVHIILAEICATEETDQLDTWFEIYKAVTVDIEWLTRCLTQYRLESFRPFLISGPESDICDLEYPPTLIESVPLTLTEQIL